MPDQNWLQRLTKSKTDKWIGGVCGGIGEHTSIPTWVWRFIFSVLFLFFGTGFFLYILLWVFMPEKEEDNH
jgi:phage shock protein C